MASGLLRQSEVIFYHPLESDVQEHTILETWNGDASFVAGKIGLAFSSIISNDIIMQPLDVLIPTSSNIVHENNPVNIINLSETSVVLVYSSNAPSGSNTSLAIAGTVSGTTTTWGSGVQFNDSHPWGGKQLNVVALDSTHVIIGYSKPIVQGGYARVGVVDGNNITFGDEFQYTIFAMDGELITVPLSPTRAVLFYRAGTGKPNGLVCAISGTDIFFGTPVQFSTVTAPVNSQAYHEMDMVALTPNKIMCFTSESIGTGEDVARIGIIGGPSGTDISWGPSVSIGFTELKYMDAIKIDNDTAILSKTGNTSGAVCRICSVIGASGADIDLGSEFTYKTGGAGEVDMTLMSSGNVLMSYKDNVNNGNFRMASISGTSISFKPETPIPAFSIFPSLHMDESRVQRLTDSKFLFAGADFHSGSETIGSLLTSIGSLEASAGISGISNNYPSISGATRVTFAMWSNELTSDASVIKINRGYDVTLNSSGISLGESGAIWNDVDISSLMTVVNDGSNHMMVFDFGHISGTTWNLNTSIDGDPFVDQGQQNTGTKAVVTVDTDPGITIATGRGASQWIDELVMWAGDKDTFVQFSNIELQNLYLLGQASGLTMDQYRAFASSAINSAINMYISGPSAPGVPPAPDFEKVIAPGTFADRIVITPQTFTIAKELSVEPQTSGVSVSSIVNFFEKDLPFNSEVVSVKAVTRIISPNAFDGTGGSISILIESSDEADQSPKVPFDKISIPTPVWDILIPAVECKSVQTNNQCFDAPGDGVNTIDSTYSSLPKWSSLRATITAQVDDQYVGVGSPVRVIVMAELRPTNLREQRYF